MIEDNPQPFIMEITIISVEGHQEASRQASSLTVLDRSSPLQLFHPLHVDQLRVTNIDACTKEGLTMMEA